MLVLPSQQVYSFIMSEDSIDNYREDLYAHRAIVEPGGETPTTEEYLSGITSTGEIRTINHKVGRGETLSTIASKYGMTTDELMALNGMSSERVRRGDNLKVKAPAHSNASADNDDMVAMRTDDQGEAPVEDMAMSEQAQFDEVKNIEREAATKAPYKGSYTAGSSQETTRKSSVKSDDQTARQRASRSNNRDWHDRNNKYNKSKSDRKSSSRSENTAHSSRSSKHKKQSKPQQPTEVTVQKGESLTKIAEKTGVSVKDLERANGIENGNKIKAGEKIKIPTKAEAKAAANEKKSGSKGDKSSKSDKGGKGSKSSGKSSKASKDFSSKSSKSSKGSSGKSSKKSKKK